ncbi:MAG TPA: hypothetical protein VGX00_02200 [Thermoplasmata archaeon]|nr:hypothetical protein [Thermoplasmata archaeon]
MVAKTMWATLLAVGFMAVSGLGFAAFTVGPLVATNTASSGSASWTIDSQVLTSSEASANCAMTPASGATATLAVSGSNFAPGDWCTATANVHNTGTLDLTVTWAVSGATNPSCFSYQTGNPVGTNVPVAPGSSFSLPAGSTHPFFIAVELTEGVGSSCSSESSGTYTLTFTAVLSANPSESTEPGGGAAANL